MHRGVAALSFIIHPVYVCLNKIACLLGFISSALNSVTKRTSPTIGMAIRQEGRARSFRES